MFWKLLLATALPALSAWAQLRPANNPLDSAPGRRSYVYKTTPQGDLKVDVFLPPNWQPGQKRPAILMFFGGGFVGGTPAQFYSKATYLAGRGLVALTPEYRVKNRHQTEPDKSIEDAKSAIRWVRINARELGVDPLRVVASGGSAGATCSVLAALSEEFEPQDEDRSVSSRPDALVLYNPALVVPGTDLDPPRGPQMRRVLSSWKIAKGAPPMVLFFGSEDPLLAASREMARQAAQQGTHVEFYVAPDQKHGFFNDAKTARNASPGWHEIVLRQTDLFLVSLGYLKGEPTIGAADPSLKLQRDLLQTNAR